MIFVNKVVYLQKYNVFVSICWTQRTHTESERSKESEIAGERERQTEKKTRTPKNAKQKYNHVIELLIVFRRFFDVWLIKTETT